MNAADFDDQFNRLTAHFHMAADANRATVSMDWYQAVQHYHVDALERGVTDVIRNATDRFWPPLGKLLEAIRGRMAGVEKTRNTCATCHGSTWIESRPWKSNHRIYEGFQRCPDCGVPAPVHHVGDHREELTATEYAQWMRREFVEPEMYVARSKHVIGKSHGMSTFQQPKEVA